MVRTLNLSQSDGLVAQDLAAEYERLCAEPSDIYLHLPRLKMIVESLDAQHVIELGTRSGVSTVAFLHALEQTGGRLTSVDIDQAPEIGDWAHWTFIRGDDLDPGVLARLDPADVVFIDTSHLYAHTIRELNVYRWLVKPGGVIVCHDTQLARPEGAPSRPLFPVKTAIEEFCAAEGFQWSEYPDCWGLGVIKVG
jgi:predicted O-methyltransferase YrrM